MIAVVSGKKVTCYTQYLCFLSVCLAPAPLPLTHIFFSALARHLPFLTRSSFLFISWLRSLFHLLALAWLICRTSDTRSSPTVVPTLPSWFAVCYLISKSILTTHKSLLILPQTGESGLGKTTFINTLFTTSIKEYKNPAKRHEKQLDRTVEIEITKAGKLARRSVTHGR